MNSIDENYVIIEDSGNSSTTITFSLLNGGDKVMALVHVYIPSGGVAAINFQFYRQLPHIVGLAGSIPLVEGSISGFPASPSMNST